MAKGNLVAKNLHRTSRAVTHVDRRKAEKAGYSKHKKGYVGETAQPFCYLAA